MVVLYVGCTYLHIVTYANRVNTTVILRCMQVVIARLGAFIDYLQEI